MSLIIQPFTGRLTKFAHSLWEERISPESIVLDATLGNGHDAEFLCSILSHKGKFYGIDIQKNAVESSSERLKATKPSVPFNLKTGNHADWNLLFPELHKIDFACFNLGYLPGGNHEIATHSESTLLALEKIIRASHSNSQISIIAYRGHNGGKEEYEAILNFLKNTLNLPIKVWETGNDKRLGPCLIYLRFPEKV